MDSNRFQQVLTLKGQTWPQTMTYQDLTLQQRYGHFYEITNVKLGHINVLTNLHKLYVLHSIVSVICHEMWLQGIN